MNGQNKNKSEEISRFADKLIEDKNFGNLNPEIREQIKDDLTERIEDKINLAILDNMSPEKLEEFNLLLDQGDMLEVQEFCRVNVPDMENVIARELVRFREVYLNS